MSNEGKRTLIVTAGKSPKHYGNRSYADPKELLKALREQYPDPQDRLEQLENLYVGFFNRQVHSSNLQEMVEMEWLGKQAGQERGGKVTQTNSRTKTRLAIQAWEEMGKGEDYQQAWELFPTLCKAQGLKPWKTRHYFDEAIDQHRKTPS